MFLPQSLPSIPLGPWSADLSSVCLISMQHKTTNTWQVFGQLPVGDMDSAALFLDCLIEPDPERGAKQDRASILLSRTASECRVR